MSTLRLQRINNAYGATRANTKSGRIGMAPRPSEVLRRGGSRRVGVINPDLLTNVATTVANFISNLFGGGDKVPNYPIRSGTTYNKIVNEISATFKEPSDLDAALWYDKEAQRWIDEAVRKKNSGEASPAVMDTYIMMLQDLQAIYGNYIDNDVWTAWTPTPGTPSGGGGININLPGPGGDKTNFPPPDVQPKTAGMSTIAMIGVGVLALSLLSKRRR